MGCGKFLVVTLTTFILLSGLALLGYGIYHIVQSKGFDVTGSQILDIALVSVAGILSFIGFVGVIGICCSSRCWLKMYFLLILLMLLAKIGLAVYAGLNMNGFEKLVSSGWNKQTDESRIEMQKMLKCCGMGTVDTSLPSSNHSSCYESANGNAIQYDDCLTVVKVLIKKHIYLVAGVCGGLAFIELLLLICLPILISQMEDGGGGSGKIRRTKVHPLPANQSHRATNESTNEYQRPNRQTLDQSSLNAQRQAEQYKQRQSVVMEMHGGTRPHGINGGTRTHQRNEHGQNNYGYN